MYLSDLAAQLRDLSGDVAEVATALTSGYFDVLQRRYPNDTVRPEAARQRYLETAETYYFKSMLMAMTISVVGSPLRDSFRGCAQSA
jgi:hypothetical protein